MPRTLWILSLALLSFDAAAQAQIRPGLWEVSMTGVPNKQTMCITPAMAGDMKNMAQQRQPNSDCKASNESSSGNTRSVNVSCTKPARYDAKITQTINGPDNFSMTQDYSMEMNGRAQKGSMSMSYRRVGDCKQ